MPPKRAGKTKLVRISCRADIETAVDCSISYASEIGFKSAERCMIGTTVSELATNIFRYATAGGEIRIAESSSRKTGIVIIAKDDGPGIKNLKKAMKDSYTTTVGSLGIGLPGARRLMDVFRIQSGRGTVVTVKKWLK